MKWQVQLSGDDLDLRELCKSLTDADLRIHENNGQYFLESSKFEQLTTQQEVSSLAAEILTAITGAVRLSIGRRTPLHVVSIVRGRPDGGRNIFVTVEDQVSIRNGQGVGMQITRADGTIEVINPIAHIYRWVKMSLSDPKVAKALRLFGTGEHDWVSLYRLYEVIEEDTGGIDNIVRHGGTTKASIKRFTHTANSPTAAGDTSRHGTESTMPPPDPMALDEARSLVKVILHDWLRSKVQH